MKYKTLLIGLGQIGMGYDYNSSDLGIAWTHAKSISMHNDFDLVAGVDITRENREKFTKKFKKPAFKSYASAIKELKPDIIVIATSTNTHLSIIKGIILSYSPKIIILEKPLAYKIKEANQIYALSQDHNIEIAINFFREYEPVYKKLAQEIKNGLLGFPLKANVRYSKGFINNASHWVQYFSNFFGNFINLVISESNSLGANDQSINTEILYKNGSVNFISQEELGKYIFELDLTGPSGKVSINSAGTKIKYYNIMDTSLAPDSSMNEYPDMQMYQIYIYNEVSNFLNFNHPLSCSISSLDQNLQIYEYVDKELKNE